MADDIHLIERRISFLTARLQCDIMALRHLWPDLCPAMLSTKPASPRFLAGLRSPVTRMASKYPVHVFLTCLGIGLFLRWKLNRHGKHAHP